MFSAFHKENQKQWHTNKKRNLKISGTFYNKLLKMKMPIIKILSLCYILYKKRLWDTKLLDCIRLKKVHET